MELLYHVVLRWHDQEQQHKKRQQQTAKQTGAHFVSKPGHFPDHLDDLHCQKRQATKLVNFSGLWGNVDVDTNAF